MDPKNNPKNPKNPAKGGKPTGKTETTKVVEVNRPILRLKKDALVDCVPSINQNQAPTMTADQLRDAVRWIEDAAATSLGVNNLDIVAQNTLTRAYKSAMQVMRDGNPDYHVSLNKTLKSRDGQFTLAKLVQKREVSRASVQIFSEIHEGFASYLNFCLASFGGVETQQQIQRQHIKPHQQHEATIGGRQLPQSSNAFGQGGQLTASYGTRELTSSLR